MSASSPLDAFIPNPDARERFHTTVRAPAPLVLETAAGMDLQALPLVRAIFRLREIFMRAAPVAPRTPQGLLAEMRSLGWGVLLEQPGRLIVCGATCRPWQAEVTFTSLPPEAFATFHEPDLVKIVWTLETEALGAELTRFAHETRVAASDPAARAKFMRYWRWARFGIVGIRWLLLPSIRRTAERRWAAERGVRPGGTRH